MLPTFLIAGAGKSGTTSLWTYLGSHPDICMASEKEPQFFTDEPGDVVGDGVNARRRGGRFRRGLDWYRSLFDDCAGSVARGEASDYLTPTDAAARIREIVPDVRLMFILRDPVDRMNSHYWQERKKGVEWPPLPEMVEADHPRVEEFVDASSYGRHLPRFYDVFSDEQILLLLFDDLVHRPRSLVIDAFRHVGVDPTFEPPSLGETKNPAAAPRSPTLERLLNVDGLVDRLKRLPEPVVRVAAAVKRSVSRLNLEPVDTSMSPELRARLLPRFEEDIAYVEERLCRPLPSWRSIGQGSTTSR